MSDPERLSAATTIVLDNISISDLPGQAWTLLEQQVRQRGTSLWVLGGDNSFSAGGYRGSPLEQQLLPVLSEPASQEPAAAVVFLIDHSGSMGASDGTNVALSMANRAVQASVATLGAQDQIGLVEFADSARLVAAPGSHSRAQLLQLLTLQASGGTQLAVGLEQALLQLQQSELEQRLLVLVTDGFTSDFDVTAWRLRLREAGVTLVALAVGAAPDTAILEQLAWSADSRVIKVNNSTELPRLMSGAVASQRNPTQGATQVIQRRSLGNTAPAYQWPPVARWQATRPKPEALQYLVAATGEPLLAQLRAGAGRVLALPAGLYDWVPAWQQWPQLPAIMNQLLQLGGGGRASDTNALQVQQVGRGLRVVAETSVHRPTAAAMHLSVYGPDIQRRDLVMRAIAPGLYAHTVQALQAGEYLLQVRQGELEMQQAHYQQPMGELRAALDAGLLQLWSAQALAELDITDRQQRPRQLALLAAILVYLTSLLLESGRPRPLRRSLPR